MSAPGDPLPEESFARRVAVGTLVVAGVGCGFGVLYLFWDVVFLLFVAIVLATAIKPLVGRLVREGRSPTVAVGLVYAALGLVLLTAAVLLLPLVVDQFVQAVSALPEAYRHTREQLLESARPWVAQTARYLPAQIGWPRPTPNSETLGTVATAASAVGPLLRAVLATLAVLVLSFYWSLQDEKTLRNMLLLVPPARREGIRDLLAQIEDKLGAYIIGQGILCLLVGLMALVAFLLIGLPYAVVLSLSYGLLEAIPYFGPMLGAATAMFVALSVDPGKVVWVIVTALAIQGVENYLLVPRVMDKSVGVNPLVTLLAIAAFGELFGLAGAVLSIPLAAIVQLLLNRLLLAPEALEPAAPAGRDASSLLQYQVRELIQDVRLQIRNKPAAPSRGADRVEEEIESIARGLDRLLGESTAESAPEPEPAPDADLTKAAAGGPT
jgi:predicted PurR-regulated permease PerM